jgi:hypothetical protein
MTHNLKKLSNVWFVQEQLTMQEKSKSLEVKLAKLRKEHVNGPQKIKMSKDASTQTQEKYLHDMTSSSCFSKNIFSFSKRKSQ